MKNFIKLISSAALLVMFSFALSSYDVQPIDDPGNGTIVEVVKGEVWTFYTACPDGISYQTEKTTRQYKDGEVHMITLVWKLPKDNCWIQKKAYKTTISGMTVNFTPSGTAISKLIVNE